jgi:hypothetical protein
MGHRVYRCCPRATTTSCSATARCGGCTQPSKRECREGQCAALCSVLPYLGWMAVNKSHHVLAITATTLPEALYRLCGCAQAVFRKDPRTKWLALM